MDPNANLAEMLRLTDRLLKGESFRGKPYSRQLDSLDTDARRLAELVEALNEWISGGGFRPAAWGGPTPCTNNLSTDKE